MNTLQDLIQELKNEKTACVHNEKEFYRLMNVEKEKAMAFDVAIAKAEKLLKFEMTPQPNGVKIN